MSARERDLERRRAELVSRARGERAELTLLLVRVSGPLTLVDRGLAIARRPSVRWLVASGLALVAPRPRASVRWVRRTMTFGSLALGVWRLARSLRAAPR